MVAFSQRLDSNDLGDLFQLYWFHDSMIACTPTCSSCSRLQGEQVPFLGSSCCFSQPWLQLAGGFNQSDFLPTCRVRNCWELRTCCSPSWVLSAGEGLRAWGKQRVLQCIRPETLAAAALSPRDQVRSVLWGCCLGSPFPSSELVPGAVWELIWGSSGPGLNLALLYVSQHFTTGSSVVIQ